MARAALVQQARGERVHSTGTHIGMRDRMPMMQQFVDVPDRPTEEEFDSLPDMTASFERMMRTNRAAGL